MTDKLMCWLKGEEAQRSGCCSSSPPSSNTHPKPPTHTLNKQQPIHDALSLLRRTGDIIASQWVPDVFSIMAWYGVYTWLPLEFKGQSVAAQLTYVAAGVAIALGAYAVSGFGERGEY